MIEPTIYECEKCNEISSYPDTDLFSNICRSCGGKLKKIEDILPF